MNKFDHCEKQLQKYYDHVQALLTGIEHLTRISKGLDTIGRQAEPSRANTRGRIELYKDGKKIDFDIFKNAAERFKIIVDWRIRHNTWERKGYYLKIELEDIENGD